MDERVVGRRRESEEGKMSYQRKEGGNEMKER